LENLKHDEKKNEKNHGKKNEDDENSDGESHQSQRTNQPNQDDNASVCSTTSATSLSSEHSRVVRFHIDQLENGEAQILHKMNDPLFVLHVQKTLRRFLVHWKSTSSEKEGHYLSLIKVF
jgi:hypothetical protein